MALIETWTIPHAARIGERRRSALAEWIAARWVALSAGAVVLIGVGLAQGVNDANWPSFVNDDQGTYMARAWAVLTGQGAHHSLANYTYWYDHPPLAWMQLAPLAWLTDAFRSGGIAVIDGRRIMLVYALASTVLVYVIARRLGASVVAGLVAMAIFGLSPLSIDYLRQIFLDNIGLPWLLASFALLLSPQRRLSACIGSGLCFGIACLSKETFLLWLPVLLWQLWSSAERGDRSMRLAAFGTPAPCFIVLYPLYAALKGELVPGYGHVSLIGAIEWQLASRSSSGSVLSAHSSAHLKVLGWFHDDPLLIGGSLVAMPVAFAWRRLRPLACGVAVPVLYVLHPGYLPTMFVIGALPFAALTIACTGDALWGLDPVGVARATIAAWRPRLPALHAKAPGPLAPSRLMWRSTIVGVCAAALVGAVPLWSHADRVALTQSVNTPLWRAEAWIEQHAPRRDTVVVDENLWTDLVDDGFSSSKVVAFWELGTDPEVDARYPQGWRQMDYVVVSATMRVNVVSGHMVAVANLIAYSDPVASFGSGSTAVQIRRLTVHQAPNPPSWMPLSATSPSSVPPTQQGAPQ